MAIYSFVPPFREAIFCGIPSRVFDKSGCAAGEKKVAEHWSNRHCWQVFQKILLTRIPRQQEVWSAAGRLVWVPTQNQHEAAAGTCC
jgi:hypothetical protein